MLMEFQFHASAIRIALASNFDCTGMKLQLLGGMYVID